MPITKTELSLLWLLAIATHTILIFGIVELNAPDIDNIKPGEINLVKASNGTAKRVVFILVESLSYSALTRSLQCHQDSALFLVKLMTESGVWGMSEGGIPFEARESIEAIASGVQETPSLLNAILKIAVNHKDNIFDHSRTYFFGSNEMLSVLNTSEWNSTAVEPSELDEYTFNSIDQWTINQINNMLKRTAPIEKSDNSTDPIEKLGNSIVKSTIGDQSEIYFIALNSIDNVCRSFTSTSRDFWTAFRFIDVSVKRITAAFESYFEDNSTAYILTSDQGCPSLGSNRLINISRTPFFAWGKGIREGAWHQADANTTKGETIRQTDVASLMSCLLGSYYPRHSIGLVPAMLLSSDELKHECLQSNMIQISNLREYYSRVRGVLMKNQPISETDDETGKNVMLSRQIKRLQANVDSLYSRMLFTKKLVIILGSVALVGLVFLIVSTFLPRKEPDPIPLGSTLRILLKNRLRWVLTNLYVIICDVTAAVALTLSIIITLKQEWPPIVYLLFGISILNWWLVLRNGRVWISLVRPLPVRKCLSYFGLFIVYTCLFEGFMLSLGSTAYMGMVFIVILMYAAFGEMYDMEGCKTGNWLITSVPMIVFAKGGAEDFSLSLLFLIPTALIWIGIIIIYISYLNVSTRDWPFLVFCCVCILMQAINSCILVLREDFDEKSPDILHITIMVSSVLPVIWLPFVASEKVATRVLQVMVSLSIPIFALTVSFESFVFLLISVHLLTWMLIESFSGSSFNRFLNYKLRESVQNNAVVSKANIRRAFFLIVYAIMTHYAVGFSDRLSLRWVTRLLMTNDLLTIVSLGFLKATMVAFAVLIVYIYTTRIARDTTSKSFLLGLLFGVLASIHTLIAFSYKLREDYMSQRSALAHHFQTLSLTLILTLLYPLGYLLALPNLNVVAVVSRESQTSVDPPYVVPESGTA